MKALNKVPVFLNEYRQLCWFVLLLFIPFFVFGHNISENNARFVESINGPAIMPFMYLGAKHMVTGYDHLLFLFGVLFFLHRFKDVFLFVTIFTFGHSITLMLGVLLEVNVNVFLVDAVIGLSVVYKAFENLDGFRQVFGKQMDARAAVFVFGLCHGLGLATKLQEFSLSNNGLVTNILSFNIGVEIGQAIALAFILVILGQWRRIKLFQSHAFVSNSILMSLGFMLAGYQIAGYMST
jgi:hypothetical protein